MTFTSKSAVETKTWARQLAGQFLGGEVIALDGELGAGKTVVSQGIAEGLGIKQIVNSPTFVLMKVYPVKNHGAIKNLVHVDTYRLTSPEDLLAIGLQDYLGQAQTVVVVEWASKIKKILPSKTKYFKLEHQSENQRLIRF